MAETTTNGSPRSFGQASTVYAAAQSASLGDFRNCIDARLAQLDAALVAIHGDGFASFSCMSERHQDNYLWMLHSMVSEVRDLMGAMDGAAAKEAGHDQAR